MRKEIEKQEDVALCRVGQWWTKTSSPCNMINALDCLRWPVHVITFRFALHLILNWMDARECQTARRYLVLQVWHWLLISVVSFPYPRDMNQDLYFHKTVTAMYTHNLWDVLVPLALKTLNSDDVHASNSSPVSRGNRQKARAKHRGSISLVSIQFKKPSVPWRQSSLICWTPFPSNFQNGDQAV